MPRCLAIAAGPNVALNLSMPPASASAFAGARCGGLMLVPQKPVHAGPCDAEAACYFGATRALGRQLAHQASVDGRPAALVDAAGLGCGNPLKLAFLAQVGLELGEHGEHVEERLARGGAGVDRLL